MAQIHELKCLSEEGGKCPYCGSDELDDTHTELDGEDVKYYVKCASCGRNYVEIYTLTFGGNWGE